MPSYYGYTVPVPAVKHISRKNINGAVYIYYTYAREVSAKGNLAPKNQSIGKLKPDTDPPEMYPNLNYFKYFDANDTAAGEKSSSEPGFTAEAPEISSGSDLTKAAIETRAERLITGLTLIRDDYRDLAQEMLDSGLDPDELEKQVSSLFQPGWIYSME